MMRVSADLLATLAAAVSEGTFDAAARALHVTPSAVSQRVKSLEQQLGRVLLVRSRPIRPTDAGAVLLRLGRQLALLERDALDELGTDAGADSDDGRRVSLPIAVNADSLASWILPALARVAEREPVVLDITRDDQSYTAALLADGSVMAAVTSDSRAVSGCTVTVLGRMTYRPMSTPAFAARWFADGVHAVSLAVAPHVDFDRKDDLQSRFVRAVAGRELTPPRHFVPASVDFVTAVRLGLGWGMLPGLQADAAVAAGELVELHAGEAIDVPLYWQQWDLRSRLLDLVAAEVRAEATRVLTR